MSDAPTPRITDVNRPFWDGCRSGALMLQRCSDAGCDRFLFYPRVCCPYCGNGDLVWAQASGLGRLQSWTLVHRPGHDAFLPDVPYVFAAVALAEGPLIYGRLLVSPDAPYPAIGSAVRVIFSEGAGGTVLPTFAPIR